MAQWPAGARLRLARCCAPRRTSRR